MKPTAPPPGPCAMVIFGAGGDLTRRLLVPALYNLARTGLLPDSFALIGVDLAPMTAEEWAGRLRAMLEGAVGSTSGEDRIDALDPAVWQRLTDGMSTLQGDFADPALYQHLRTRLQEIAGARGTGGNVLFYLAVADRFFAPVAEQLGQAGLLAEPDGPGSHWRRLVVEKPFGHSLESARALNRQLRSIMEESQIYRIDHFLGKETVQNIIAFRFANGIFEPIWNRDRIDHVQITVAEQLGVERRGKFYEATGALRDMVPNHVFQILAMIAMEPPGGFGAERIRDRKADVFAQLHTLTPEDAVRGQYGPGAGLPGYRAEPDVAPQSATETFVALRLKIDNWRWAGVPFYLRTGKRLSARATEVAIRFKPAPFAPFADTDLDALPPNWLVLKIQPDEGISLQFEVKRPGQVMALAPAALSFRYADWFPREPNVGYETLIYDSMIGDQTLFQRADMVEQTWRVVQPVLDAWATAPAPYFPNYAAGQDGPEAASRLLAADGRAWRAVAQPAQVKP